MFYCICL